MKERQLTVVAPRGYPWTFNGPRQSRHRVKVRSYAPLNKLRSNLDGLTLFSPLDTGGAECLGHLLPAQRSIDEEYEGLRRLSPAGARSGPLPRC